MGLGSRRRGKGCWQNLNSPQQGQSLLVRDSVFCHWIYFNSIMRTVQASPPTVPESVPLSVSRCPKNIKGKKNYSLAMPQEAGPDTPLLEIKTQDGSHSASKKYGLRRLTGSTTPAISQPSPGIWHRWQKETPLLMLLAKIPMRPRKGSPWPSPAQILALKASSCPLKWSQPEDSEEDSPWKMKNLLSAKISSPLGLPCCPSHPQDKHGVLGLTVSWSTSPAQTFLSSLAQPHRAKNQMTRKPSSSDFGWKRLQLPQF